MQTLKRKITSGILATIIALTPMAPEIKVLADEIPSSSDTAIVETSSDDGTQNTDAVMPSDTSDISETSESNEPVDENVPDDTIEVTDPSDSIDTTAPPTEGTEDSSDVTTVDETDVTDVTSDETEATEPTDETEETETSETTEPTEETIEITCVPVCEDDAEWNAFIASLGTDVWKIYVITEDDLVDISYDYGMYYEGGYCFGFDTEEKFNTAIEYLTANGYEFTKTEAIVSHIVYATTREEFVLYISNMTGAKLIINTTDNIDDLNPDCGVYFDGTYVVTFADQTQYFNAASYCASMGYEYSIDGDLEVCGDTTIPTTVLMNSEDNTVASSDARIAVIDTGSSIFDESYSVLGDDGADRNGHGTRMVQNITMFSDAYIISIKALGDDGHGDVSDVYAAIQMAQTMDVDYILLAMSLTDNGEYEAFKALIEECKEQGITVVASAGNNNKSADLYIPANCATYTVGAVNADGTKNVFSNYDADYYVCADTTSDAASKFLAYLIADTADLLIYDAYLTEEEANATPEYLGTTYLEVNMYLSDADGNPIDPVEFTINGFLSPTEEQHNGYYSFSIGYYDNYLNTGYGQSYSWGGNTGRTQAQAEESARASARLNVTPPGTTWYQENSSALSGLKNKLYSLGVGSVTTGGGLTDGSPYYTYAPSTTPTANTIAFKATGVWTWHNTVTWTVSFEDGSIPTNSSMTPVLRAMADEGTYNICTVTHSDGTTETYSINFTAVANQLNADIKALRLSQGYCYRTDGSGWYSGSGRGHNCEEGTAYCANPGTGHTYYHDLSLSSSIHGEGLIGTTYDNYNTPMPSNGDFSYNGLAIEVAKILDPENGYSDAQRQAWIWDHCGVATEVNGGKISGVPTPANSGTREITSADGAKVAPFATGWDGSVVNINLVPNQDMVRRADGAYLLIPTTTYTFTDTNGYLQYMDGYVSNNAGLYYAINGNTLTVRLDPASVTNWGALATGTATLGMSRDNVSIDLSDSAHNNMRYWESWNIYLYGPYNNYEWQEHIDGNYDWFTAQWDMRGSINFYTNLYVQVTKNSANPAVNGNNCYSMEGLQFYMTGNNTSYTFTQTMGQFGGETQAIKLNESDMAANNWVVYENLNSLPVRNFMGYNFNSGFLYDTSGHAVDYSTAQYLPNTPVQGGGYADDGAVIVVDFHNNPVGDPLSQSIKKEDDEKWDEINDDSIASTYGIQFTVYYYQDYFYDSASLNSATINSTALKTYFDTHNPTATSVVTIDGRNTSQYGMFTLDGHTCPEFSLDGSSRLKLGTYIVRETATNDMYYLNSEPLFGTVISQETNGYQGNNYRELRQLYFYNGGDGRALYLNSYPAQGYGDFVTYGNNAVCGYARLEKELVLPTGVNEPLNGYEYGTSMEDTIYGIFSANNDRLYAVVVLSGDAEVDDDGNLVAPMASVTYAPDLNVNSDLFPTINLTGGASAQYFRLPTGNYYAVEAQPNSTADTYNTGIYPDGTTNAGQNIVLYNGQVVNESMFYWGTNYSATSGVQGERINFTVTASETPTNVTVAHATDYPANAEFDFYLNKQAYNGWNYIGAEFTIYSDEACTDAIMTLTDNNDGHYVSTEANNIRDYLTYSPTSYTVTNSGDLSYTYTQTVYFKETQAPTVLRDANGNEWTLPEVNRNDVMDTDSVYRVDISLTGVSQTTHIGTLTYTISGGQIATPYSVTIQNYNAHESHNHNNSTGAIAENNQIILSNYLDNVYYEDSMSLELIKTTDTPFLDINNNGRDDNEDYHFEIGTTSFYVTSGPLAGGYPTFTMAQLKNAKNEGRNLLKEYMLGQENLIGYYEFGEDQWYDGTGTALPDGWDRLYGLMYDKTYYIYEVFEVPEYAYDNDNDPNPPGQNGVYDIAGEIFEIVNNQNNNQTIRVNTPRTYSSIPYPNVATGQYNDWDYTASEWEQSSYFNTMWEMHFDTPTSTADKMDANTNTWTFDANNHLLAGAIDLNKVWSENNTDEYGDDLAGFEFLFEYGGNLDRAYWDMSADELEAVGLPAYDEMPHTYIIRLTDVNGNIHLEDIPAGWYRISENTNNMEVRFHSDRGADEKARAVIKLADDTEEVFYVANIMDVPIYVSKYDTWTSQPVVIDPFTGERRAYEGDYSLLIQLFKDSNFDGQITGAERDTVRSINDRSHSGMVVFNGLEGGQYAVREIITADGYYLESDFRYIRIYDLDASGKIEDDIFEIRLYDQPYSAPIEIEKFDDSGNPMDNAEFTIYYDDGSVIGEWDEQDTRAMTWEPTLDADGNQVYEQIPLGYNDANGNWIAQLDDDGNPMFVDGAPIGTYREANVWWDATQGKYISDPLRAYHVWNSATGQWEHRNYVVVESGLPYGYSFTDANGEPTVRPNQALFAIEYPDMQADDENGNLSFTYVDGAIDPVENVVEITVQNFSFVNTEIHIATEALSIQNNSHTLEVGETVDVQETVNWQNLAPTGRYTVRGYLVDRDEFDASNPTANAVATTSQNIVAEAKNGTTVLTFTNVNSADLVRAIVAPDGTVSYEPKDLVSIVYIDWDSDFDIYDGPRADHIDKDDTNEIVTIVNPTLGTTLTGTVNMTHEALIGQEVAFTDKVDYTNLSIGEEYYVMTSIVDKETGEVIQIIDADGNLVDEVKTTFTVPDTALLGNGSMESHFLLDTASLLTVTVDANGVVSFEGRDIVCYERLYTSSGIYIATHEEISDTAQTVTITPPTVETTFLDGISNEHMSPIGQDVPMKDIVTITNLNPGETYYVEGTLHNAETGEILVNGETGLPYTTRISVDATTENYELVTATVPFEVDTADFVEWDTEENTLKTTNIVCFERIYASDGTTLIGVHEDLEDDNQTVTIVPPTLHTTLVDVASNSHDGSFGTSITLSDKVDYNYASEGTEYTIRGELWKVNDDGSVEKLFDADDEVTFTPTTRNGTVYVTFSNIDSTALCENGQPIKVVCFEYMFCTAMVDDDNDDTTPTVPTEVQISSHEDATDQNQTVEFTPECQTTLLTGTVGGEDINGKEMERDAEVILQDTVTYHDLIVGEHYTIEGQIVNKADGSPILHADGTPVVASTDFVAETSTGTAVVTFTVNTASFCYKVTDENGNTGYLKPTDIVCFETLISDTGYEFCIHADLNDENQTVTLQSPPNVTPPFIRTTATDAGTGTHELTYAETVTINDRVEYWNLCAGMTYSVTGTIMDKSTGLAYVGPNGETYTKTVEFTPTTSDGYVDVVFENVAVPLTVGQLVVFEDLKTNGYSVYVHADINDENQTVYRPLIMGIQIAKMDFDNVSYYLAGAEITVYTGDGQVARDVNGNECIGVTGADGKVEFQIMYQEGQTYYAMETKAPAGYQLNTDKFDITPTDTKAYGTTEIIPISIFDKMIIIPPKTGDNMPIMALIAIMIIGAVGLTAVFVVRSKKKGQVESEKTTIEGVSNENPENDQN